VTNESIKIWPIRLLLSHKQSWKSSHSRGSESKSQSPETL